jgi:HK97 family phage prohead protease
MSLYHKKDGKFERIENPVAFFKAMRDKKEIDEKGNINVTLELYKYMPIVLDEKQKKADGPITMVMSDYSLDRHEERIDQAGWELENFKKNPVLLWDHTNWYLPVGRVDNVRIEENELKGNMVFTPKSIPQSGMGPQGYVVGELIRTGFLFAGSVGMLVKRVEFQDDTEEVILRKQELLEFSIVTVPANPNALVQNSFKQNYSLPMMRDALEQGILPMAKSIPEELTLEDINKKLTEILEILKLPETAIPNIGEIDSHKTSGTPDQNQEPEQEEITKPVFFLKRGKNEK